MLRRDQARSLATHRQPASQPVVVPSSLATSRKATKGGGSFIMAGIDISLSNLGLSKFHYRNGHLEPLDSKLVVSKPEDKRMKVRKNSDDLNRATSFVKELHEFIDGCDFIFIELPVGSQSARAMASYGISVGIIASLYNYPIILVLPSEVKMVVGNATASKRDMINWASKLYPEFKWTKGKKQLADKNEHVADSCAAVIAGLKTQEFIRAYTLSR